ELPDDNVSVFVVNYNGRRERALMVTHWGDAAYAQFLASTGENTDQGLDDFLYFETACFLKMNFCCKRFVLGGGLTAAPDDSLLRFKLGFSSERAPLRSYFRLGNEDGYKQLSDRKRQAEIAEHGRESASTFLPVYRREFV